MNGGVRSEGETSGSAGCRLTRLISSGSFSGVTVARLRLRHVPFGNGIEGLALPGSLDGLADLVEQASQ